MPAKAAGTSLKDFATSCNEKGSPFGKSYSKLMDNFLNHDFDSIISNSLRMPPVITSHMYDVDHLLYMIRNVPRNTLLIYVHREETHRVQSAINEVVTNWCRRGNGHQGIVLKPPPNFFYKEVGSSCYVNEDTLLNEAIRKKRYEIGIGATELLTCETYEAIKSYAPNFVFINHKQSNTLQEVIAEKYCQVLTNSPPVQSNVASEKKYEAYVKVKGLSESIPLSTWLKAKSGTLEWALGLNSGASCIAKTRMMENNLLLTCDSGILNTAVTED